MSLTAGLTPSRAHQCQRWRANSTNSHRRSTCVAALHEDFSIFTATHRAIRVAVDCCFSMNVPDLLVMTFDCNCIFNLTLLSKKWCFWTWWFTFDCLPLHCLCLPITWQYVNPPGKRLFFGYLCRNCKNTCRLPVADAYAERLASPASPRRPSSLWLLLKTQMHTAQRKHTARTHTGPLSPKLQQMLPLTNHYSSISTAINKPSAETSRKSFADNELVNVVCSLRLLTFLLMPFAVQTAGPKKTPPHVCAAHIKVVRQMIPIPLFPCNLLCAPVPSQCVHEKCVTERLELKCVSVCVFLPPSRVMDPCVRAWTPSSCSCLRARACVCGAWGLN